MIFYWEAMCLLFLLAPMCTIFPAAFWKSKVSYILSCFIRLFFTLSFTSLYTFLRHFSPIYKVTGSSWSFLKMLRPFVARFLKVGRKTVTDQSCLQKFQVCVLSPFSSCALWCWLLHLPSLVVKVKAWLFAWADGCSWERLDRMLISINMISGINRPLVWHVQQLSCLFFQAFIYITVQIFSSNIAWFIYYAFTISSL